MVRQDVLFLIEEIAFIAGGNACSCLLFLSSLFVKNAFVKSSLFLLFAEENVWIRRIHLKFIRKVVHGCLILVIARKIGLEMLQSLFAFAANKSFCCSSWNHLDFASSSSWLVPRGLYIPSFWFLSWKHNPCLAALQQKSVLWKTIPWFVWEKQMGTEGCRLWAEQGGNTTLRQ